MPQLNAIGIVVSDMGRDQLLPAVDAAWTSKRQASVSADNKSLN
jgi:hypothetical protein